MAVPRLRPTDGVVVWTVTPRHHGGRTGTEPLTPELRDLIESGPLTYLATTNSDGSPQVTMIWIGLDGDTLVSGHMRNNKKLDNIRRDPRVVLSFAPRQEPGDWMSPYASVRA